MTQYTDCPYCCMALHNPKIDWCPACRSRLQPISMLPNAQLLIRLGARIIDFLVFHALLMSALIPLLAIDMGNVLLNTYLLFWVLIGDSIGYLFYEAYLLSRWGSTPGKWLLRLSVVGPSNCVPSFQIALKRIWHLYTQLGYWGLITVSALGFVMDLLGYKTLASVLWSLMLGIAVFLNIRAYQSTRKSGMVSPWDAMLGLRVHHRVLRMERFVVAIFSLILLQAAVHYLEQWPQINSKPSQYL